jgi:hypothetical protein
MLWWYDYCREKKGCNKMTCIETNYMSGTGKTRVYPLFYDYCREMKGCNKMTCIETNYMRGTGKTWV